MQDVTPSPEWIKISAQKPHDSKFLPDLNQLGVFVFIWSRLLQPYFSASTVWNRSLVCMPFKSKFCPNNHKSCQGCGEAAHWATVGQKCQPERHDCRGMGKVKSPRKKMPWGSSYWFSIPAYKEIPMVRYKYAKFNGISRMDIPYLSTKMANWAVFQIH